ncbi:hypothetical protein BH10CYA1_BH10CYA1_03170 [soil metagenome]
MFQIISTISFTLRLPSKNGRMNVSLVSTPNSHPTLYQSLHLFQEVTPILLGLEPSVGKLSGVLLAISPPLQISIQDLKINGQEVTFLPPK